MHVVLPNLCNFVLSNVIGCMVQERCKRDQTNAIIGLVNLNLVAFEIISICILKIVDVYKTTFFSHFQI